MQMQILDCDYILVNNKPIIRLFGKTIDGNTICAFYDKFLPYFYLDCNKISFEDAIYELEKNNLKAEIVERILPIGFQKPTKVLKITGKDPSKIPEIRDFASRFGTPYEADILFKYRFMIDHNIKGMQWAEVKGKPIYTKTVKCKAFKAEKIEPVEILKNIPFRYLSLDIECLPPENRMAEPDKDEIIMIALSFYPEYKGKKEVCIIAKPTSLGIGCKDEKEMLEKLKEIIKDYDPDIITGYNIENFDIPYILRRMEIHKVQRDIGRSEKIPYTSKLTYSKRTNICGRIIIDPFYIIRYLSVYDQPYKFKRFDLGTIAKQILGETKIDIGDSYVATVNEAWKRGRGLERVVEYCKRDADLALRLVITHRLVDMDKFIEMSKLSGLLLQDTMAGQAARHESELLYELKKRNTLMPCKPRKIKRKEQQYKGALVLEPQAGLHKDGYTLVLDFTALYPSLIIHYNICPTTLVTNPNGLDVKISPSGSNFVTKEIREGVFPYIAQYLLKTRAEIKEQLKKEKNPEIRRILDAKQYALKGMAVSLYGYTGFAGGRFFTTDVASSITAWGRQTIESTKKLVEKTFGYNVIYGDSITEDRFVTIMDNNGFVRIKNIEELFQENKEAIKKRGEKEIIKLNGYSALSIDPNTHKPVWQPINEIIRHKTNKKIFRINQKWGETVVTEDHSLITNSGGSLVRTKPLEMANKSMVRVNPVPNVKKIDCIDVYSVLRNYETGTIYKGKMKIAKAFADSSWVWFGWTKRKSKIKVRRFIKVGSKEFFALCRLLGAYIAEGSSSTVETTKSRLGATISSADINWLKQLQKDHTLLFKNARASVIKSMKGTRKLKYKTLTGKVKNITYSDSTHKLQMMDGISAIFFKLFCGQKSKAKQLPDFIYHIPKKYKEIILENMIRGDGSRWADGRYTAAYRQKNFRYDTKSLHLVSGLSFLLAQLEIKYTIRYDNKKKTYRITTASIHTQKPNTKIKKESYSGYVYDLSVDGSHMFVDSCGQILLHNTDSIFVKTNITDLDEVMKKGEEISKFITQRLDGLELKFEKMFKTFLILTKKRYAGWAFEKENGKWIDKLEMRGIETVRRDWCSLTTKTMQEVLEIILKEQDVKKASRYVRGILHELASGKVPLEELTVIKGVTKSIESYNGVQPHVELAKKLRKRDPTRGSFVGERLGYVIIKGNALLSKRAEDPAYVKQKDLEIDSKYYIESQLLPPIERIFEVCGVSKSELIEGFKQKSLAGFTKTISPEQTVLKIFDSVVCKTCNWSFRRPPLTGVCPECGSELYFSGAGSIGKFILSQEE